MIIRVCRGYVVDFIYFRWIDFPVFNVAVCYCQCGGSLFIVSDSFRYQEEDFDRIFGTNWQKGKEDWRIMEEKNREKETGKQKYFYTVSEEQEGMRLDPFLAAELTGHSRSYIQKLIKNGRVFLRQERRKSQQ